jgi:hypothetical protein
MGIKIKTDKELRILAKSHIEHETTFAYEVCVEKSQIFGNVKRMKWFEDAVMEALRDEQPDPPQKKATR